MHQHVCCPPDGKHRLHRDQDRVETLNTAGDVAV
jgi:hypothetical protein